MGELLHLSWIDHKTLLSDFLHNISSTKNFCDVTICCSGKYFPVHRIILSSYSEYFREILELTPCRHPFIILKDVQSEEFESLLKFMYNGSVDIPEQNLLALTRAASHLRVKGLCESDIFGSDAGVVVRGGNFPDPALDLNGVNDEQVIRTRKFAHKIDVSNAFSPQNIVRPNINSFIEGESHSSREIIHDNNIKIYNGGDERTSLGSTEKHDNREYDADVNFEEESVVDNSASLLIQHTESVSDREYNEQSEDAFNPMNTATETEDEPAEGTSSTNYYSALVDANGSDVHQSNLVRKKRKKAISDVSRKKTLRKNSKKALSVNELGENSHSHKKPAENIPEIDDDSSVNASVIKDLRDVIESRRANRHSLEKKVSKKKTTTKTSVQQDHLENSEENLESDPDHYSWAQTEEEEERLVNLAVALSEGRIDQEKVNKLLKDSRDEDETQESAMDSESQSSYHGEVDNIPSSVASGFTSDQMVQIPTESLSMANVPVDSFPKAIADIKVEEEFVDDCYDNTLAAQMPSTSTWNYVTNDVDNYMTSPQNDTSKVKKLSAFEPVPVRNNRNSSQGRKSTRTHWNPKAKAKVLEHFSDFIRRRRVPGKVDCINCLLQHESLLSNKNWMDIMSCIQYEVRRGTKKRKKPLTSH